MAARTSPSAGSSVAAVEVVCRTGDLLGEGPLWDHRAGRLLWVDILQGRVNSWSPAEGARELVRADLLIGAVALAGDTDLLLATSQGLLVWAAATGDLRLLVNPLESPAVRFNDGRVDAAGRFWVGTMALDPARYAEPLGALYRVDPDGTVTQMEEGLTISNGLDWSPDGQTLYLTDTMRRAIYAYDFDPGAGTIANRRVLVQTAEERGWPDGLVVDTHGHLWSAGFAGGVICRYDAAGQWLEQVKLPVSCPTAMTFGGADFSTAFVTTSRHTLAAEHQEADAGALLRFAPSGRRGRPAAVFGQGIVR